MSGSAYNKIIRPPTLPQALPPSGAGAGLGKGGPGDTALDATDCERCGGAHHFAAPCPRKPLWAPLRPGDTVPSLAVSTGPLEAVSEPLSASGHVTLRARCATLVLRAGSAFGRASGDTDEKKETRAMSELILKNMKGHTGRHVKARTPLGTTVRALTSAGVLGVAATIAATLL